MMMLGVSAAIDGATTDVSIMAERRKAAVRFITVLTKLKPGEHSLPATVSIEQQHVDAPSAVGRIKERSDEAPATLPNPGTAETSLGLDRPKLLPRAL